MAGTAEIEASELSYEQARDELVRVVNELEQGSASLEESLGLWERGEALAQRCEEWLAGARVRLDTARAAAPKQAAPKQAAPEQAAPKKRPPNAQPSSNRSHPSWHRSNPG